MPRKNEVKRFSFSFAMVPIPIEADAFERDAVRTMAMQDKITAVVVSYHPEDYKIQQRDIFLEKFEGNMIEWNVQMEFSSFQKPATILQLQEELQASVSADEHRQSLTFLRTKREAEMEVIPC